MVGAVSTQVATCGQETAITRSIITTITKVQSVKHTVLGGAAAGGASQELKPREHDTLTIGGFDLLRVVARGAFGKVQLVRRKVQQRQKGTRLLSPHTIATMGMTPHQIALATGDECGEMYAMEVMKKTIVFARNRVQVTTT